MEQEYLPDCSLQEPSRMKKETCQALLTHWRERQSNGQEPFLFSYVSEKEDVGYSVIPSAYRDRRQVIQPPSTERAHPLGLKKRIPKTTMFVPGYSDSDGNSSSCGEEAGAPLAVKDAPVLPKLSPRTESPTTEHFGDLNSPRKKSIKMPTATICKGTDLEKSNARPKPRPRPVVNHITSREQSWIQNSTAVTPNETSTVECSIAVTPTAISDVRGITRDNSNTQDNSTTRDNSRPQRTRKAKTDPYTQWERQAAIQSNSKRTQ